MSIGKIIREYRKAAHLTQAELGEKVYKSAQVISNWERGYTTGITPDDLTKISSALGIQPGELLKAYMDEQLLDDSQNKQRIKAAKLYPLRETNRVPIIGSVRCGPGGLAYEYIDEYIAVDERYRPDEILAFRAEGDSMEGDGIREGDICIVHLQEDVPNGALAVVVICNGEESEGTLKHVLKDEENGVIVLQSSNSKYPPRVFTGADANNVKIIGEVVEFRHTMRIKRIHVH